VAIGNNGRVHDSNPTVIHDGASTGHQPIIALNDASFIAFYLRHSLKLVASKHLLDRRTEKQSALHIAVRLESPGGKPNRGTGNPDDVHGLVSRETEHR
jgi:hypothetical protein